MKITVGRLTSNESSIQATLSPMPGGPLWIYEPSETAIHVPSVPEERDPDPYLAFMVRPSEELFHYCLYDDATTYKTG